MGWHSTIEVSRECARALLLERVEKAFDKELEDLMDVVLDERGYNCSIHEDGADDDVARCCLEVRESEADKPRCRCGAGPGGLFKGTDETGVVGWFCPRCLGIPE